MPEKLHELQRLWLIEATRYKVLPLDDRMVGEDESGYRRPAGADQGQDAAPLRRHGTPVENCVLNIKNKSHSVTAEIVVPEKGAEGVIISQGANIGGWSLYAKDGKLKYCYNWGGFKHFFVEATHADPAGRASGPHGVRLCRRRPRQGRQGDAVTSTARRSAQERSAATLAMVFSADDGCDVGEDSGAPVSPDYGSRGNAFNGTVKGVQLAIADAAESADHLIAPRTPSAWRWRGNRQEAGDAGPRRFGNYHQPRSWRAGAPLQGFSATRATSSGEFGALCLRRTGPITGGKWSAAGRRAALQAPSQRVEPPAISLFSRLPPSPFLTRQT